MNSSKNKLNSKIILIFHWYPNTHIIDFYCYTISPTEPIIILVRKEAHSCLEGGPLKTWPISFLDQPWTSCLKTRIKILLKSYNNSTLKFFLFMFITSHCNMPLHGVVICYDNVVQ